MERAVFRSLYLMFERMTPLRGFIDEIITREALKAHKNGRFLIGDLHTHTIYSDGLNTPDQIVRKAKERELDIVAITDHAISGAPSGSKDKGGFGSNPAHFPTCKEAATRYGFTVVPGIEVSTREGHIVALFPSYEVTKKILAIENRLPARETVEKIHDAGGVAVAAHLNRRDGLGMRVFEVADIIDGIEGGGSAGQLDSTATANELCVAEVAGSDAHSRMSVGLAFTLFPRRECRKAGESSTLEDLIRCIRRRRTKAHEPPSGAFIRSLDKARWLNPIYASKSLIQLLDDKHGVLGRKMAAMLADA